MTRFVILAVFLFFHAAHAHAVSLVDDDRAQCPTAAFTSIQEAVNAAGPGDTVRACPGTYHEAVTISTSGVVLDGGGQARLTAGTDAIAIRIMANGVTVVGFEVFG